MCFSANASFTASAVLIIIGTVTVKKSTTPAQRLLSCTPLFFGIQQFAEGLLWLGLAHYKYQFLSQTATYIFLAFAQVVWPTMVPLSILGMENKPLRKKIMYGLLSMGLLISAYLAYCLLFYKVSANIKCYHINYDLFFPKAPMKYSGILYFIPTVLPPLISSIKKLRLLGLIILISYMVTQIFYQNYLISVWCFFAAVISVVVLNVITDVNKGNNIKNAIVVN